MAEKPRPRPQPAFLHLREFGNPPLSVGWSAWLASGPDPLGAPRALMRSPHCLLATSHLLHPLSLGLPVCKVGKRVALGVA